MVSIARRDATFQLRIRRAFPSYCSGLIEALYVGSTAKSPGYYATHYAFVRVHQHIALANLEQHQLSAFFLPLLALVLALVHCRQDTSSASAVISVSRDYWLACG